jgi:hypothetical protein
MIVFDISEAQAVRCSCLKCVENSPVVKGTTAGRLLEKSGGGGGYTVILPQQKAPDPDTSESFLPSLNPLGFKT